MRQTDIKFVAMWIDAQKLKARNGSEMYGVQSNIIAKYKINLPLYQKALRSLFCP